MPYRRLPNTDQARIRALKSAVEKGNMWNMSNLVISLKTLSEARNFLAKFQAAHSYYRECYANQAKGSRKHLANVKMARLYVSHFIQVLNLSMLRSEIKVSQKEMYGLPIDTFNVPDLMNEFSLIEWGNKVIVGEMQRISQGGIPIYNPTIAKVKVHYDIFLESYEQQKNLQALTSRSLESLASMRYKADDIILDIWNQVEERYEQLQPTEVRLDRCREYGVVYYYRNGEKSIGNISDENN